SLAKTNHPFYNGSVTLVGAEGINTLTIRVFDNATNVQTTTVSYWIDTTVPDINITNPSSNGTTVHTADGNVDINWTVTDVNATSTNVSVYDALGVLVVTSTISKSNGSVGARVNLKPGYYTARFGASDFAGNGVLTHISAVSFTVNAQQNTATIESELNTSFGVGTRVELLNSTGQRVAGNAYFNQTMMKKIEVNASITGVNITVNLTALGTNFNENKTAVVALTINTTVADALSTAKSSGVSGLDTIALFKNMSQYIGDNNYTDSDGTKQWVPILIAKALSRLKVLFINDDFGKDLVVLSQCVSNAAPNTTTTPNKTNACYTNGSAFVTLYVPHLSGGALADPLLGTPTINYTYPAEGALPDINDSNPVIQVLVQSLDLNISSCNYTLTNDAGTVLVSSTRFTPTQVEAGSTNYTVSIDTATNFANASIGNISVQCASNQSNISTKTQAFKVKDLRKPEVKTLTSSTSGTTTVTLRWTLATNENATCYYAASAVNISGMTIFGTSGAKSHTTTISYTSDTSGTYYFACNDTSNNGGNGANYSNSSAFSVDVTPAAAAAAASSGGGGSTTTSAATVEGPSSTKKWITPLNPGATATMNILDAKIPITSLSLVVANRVEKVEIKVTKLDKVPATAVPDGAGKVHSYLKVDTTNLKNEDVKEAKFKFKVEKAWFTANNYQVADVVLERFDGVKWSDLPTKSLGATDGVETFEATSPGFSTFAIVGRTKVEAVKAVEEAKKAEEAAKTPEVKEEPPAPAAEEKKAEAPVIPTQPKKPYTGWIVALIIVVVAVVGYFVWKKKQQ
ncbi:PGF-pre-PGF domain-containing protein, partial [Candidatus Woesearchaeota archaeon]|nr:PGF-pre-PGF domain-containing protein [Candidatus Woesearchaeota archaeon]